MLYVKVVGRCVIRECGRYVLILCGTLSLDRSVGRPVGRPVSLNWDDGGWHHLAAVGSLDKERVSLIHATVLSTVQQLLRRSNQHEMRVLLTCRRRYIARLNAGLNVTSQFDFCESDFKLILHKFKHTWYPL